jgi:hypothetical protein
VPLSQAPRMDRGDSEVWEDMARPSHGGAGAGLRGLGSTSCTPFGEIQVTTPWNGVPRTAQTAPDLTERQPPIMDQATSQGRAQSASGLVGHNVPVSQRGLSGRQHHDSEDRYQEVTVTVEGGTSDEFMMWALTEARVSGVCTRHPARDPSGTCP